MGANLRTRYPVVLAEPTEQGKLWCFWCPFCKRRHYHPPRRGLYQALCLPAIAKRHWPDGYYLTTASGEGCGRMLAEKTAPPSNAQAKRREYG